MRRSQASSAQLLRQHVAACPSAYVYAAVAGLLITVPGIAVPLLIRSFIDQYLIAGNDAWRTPVLVGMTAAFTSTAVITWLVYVVLSRFAVRLSAAQSVQFAWHVLRLPIPTVEKLGAGGLTARASSLQRQAFAAGLLLPLTAFALVTVVVYAVAIVAINVVLGLAGMTVVIGSSVLSYVMLRRRRGLQARSDAAKVALSAETTGIVSSIETIKAAAWEQWVFERWSRSRSAVGTTTSALAMDAQRLALISPVTQTIGLGLVLALGAHLVLIGELSLGTLVATQSLFLAILVLAGQFPGVGALLEAVNSVSRQSAHIEELPLDPEVLVDTPDRLAPAPTAPVSLALRNVTFSYGTQDDTSAPPLFTDLSLDVPPGSWLAVVGSSGSGKSTLARLVVGELQPGSGVIALDGVSRLALPRRFRGNRVGYVPQHPILMPGTISENITMFDDSISTEQINRALADACVADAINSRPAGLAERISATGHGFSGGELQRIAIARALVRAPGLLILDEATSALDPVVEAEVGQALRQRGCTCLLIAHRLSTVRDADEIIVMERGRVVQRGAFDELSTEGQFAELAYG
ncbi:ATP-binding cassette domain-containing protein [Mycolicibacterium confluentis]|uniref:Uncharacterized protein n=1 Tax=Mycolicibacterium confluentis TaxID=28047 RepID=A0A7I7XTW9_9MYCO|nr:ATP-binding cassette domain-containing protein [Mycolicibacterium confluentis]MCV7320898.1 ATP-binding cassette domain-containing protein [Mycolicibacterium confluentis]ORV27060.1 hypothetical protein AWB99_20035 [Mycolicibacterium confluentis]BBZ32699.1 hypothetical protein MCNF_13040 [Mycolicibacterium confluentis]